MRCVKEATAWASPAIMSHGFQNADANSGTASAWHAGDRMRDTAKIRSVAAAAIVTISTMGTWGTQANASEGHSPLLCKRYQHIVVQGTQHQRYIVRNDNYGHLRECLANVGGLANFRVVRSGARVSGAEPVAFPYIYVGCSWTICTPHSGFPARAHQVRSLLTSWRMGVPARGVWAAGIDLWFTRRPAVSGQQHGAELMIWFNSHDVAASQGPVVVIDHIRWYLEHWVTTHHGRTWQYVQLRRVHPTAHIQRLNLAPFIKAVERHGFVKRQWWLTGVEAGFEIWRGGVGLRTEQFSVRARL